MKKRVSVVLKFLIGFFSIIGVVFACIFAVRDGYSIWYKRLFYFTQQSNIWIGILSLVMAFAYVIEWRKGKKVVKDYMYILKFVFTISITITGVIFCSILGPFADADYNAWSFNSIITHAIVPILAIIDFFIDDYEIVFKKRVMFYSLIPPFSYFVFAGALSLLKVDFGRGETYPYFFMDFSSKAGLFGYVANEGQRPIVGTFYWLIVIFLLFLSISFLYYRLHPTTRKFLKRKKNILQKKHT